MNDWLLSRINEEAFIVWLFHYMINYVSIDENAFILIFLLSHMFTINCLYNMKFQVTQCSIQRKNVVNIILLKLNDALNVNVGNKNCWYWNNCLKVHVYLSLRCDFPLMEYRCKHTSIKRVQSIIAMVDRSIVNHSYTNVCFLFCFCFCFLFYVLFCFVLFFFFVFFFFFFFFYFFFDM